MKLVPIVCNTIRLDGGSMFGHVPKSIWEKSMQVDELNRVPLACRSLFLQTDDGRNVLFDVGAGNFFDPKFIDRYGIEGNFGLESELATLGLTENDIDIVILSHLHFDHAGGLLPPHGEQRRLRFPNAKYYLSKTHWERACMPHIRERASFIPELVSLLANSNRLVLIKDATQPELNFGLSFSFSDGHTIGMMLSHLELASGLLIFASDLIPGVPWVHLPVTMGYDRYPELLVEEKEQLLKKLLQRNGRLFLTHDLHVDCVRPTQTNGKWSAEKADL